MVTSAVTLTVKDYKSDVKPTWCPGCGDFAVLSATYKALADLQLRTERVVIVSGIGCSSRIPYFLSTYGVHSLHGRALPMASGVKLANPDMTVMVMGGDGDMFAIGAGHMPHAASRNLDLTTVCMDNQIYGLTKAQASPTSKIGQVTKSTPYGVAAKPINPLLTVLAAGATFVARGYSAKPKMLAELFVAGIKHKGFSFIHVISPCTEFNNTYSFYDAQATDLPADWDKSDLQKAMGLAITEEKPHLGVWYETERPVLDQVLHSLEKEIKPFDTSAYLKRFE
ncbi:MAG: 2-oxoacid:ferredoxin oxidoreductase subunit beta [Dehalococcoidia bacterium]|nr:2-oxoacid:ferredoxin oxidoreductase subunit beta [Dehalococcoidia bacterium]